MTWGRGRMWFRILSFVAMRALGRGLERGLRMDEALFPSTMPLPGLVALDVVRRRSLMALQSSSVWDAMICTVFPAGASLLELVFGIPSKGSLILKIGKPSPPNSCPDVFSQV